MFYLRKWQFIAKSRASNNSKWFIAWFVFYQSFNLLNFYEKKHTSTSHLMQICLIKQTPWSSFVVVVYNTLCYTPNSTESLVLVHPLLQLQQQFQMIKSVENERERLDAHFSCLYLFKNKLSSSVYKLSSFSSHQFLRWHNFFFRIMGQMHTNFKL